MYVTKRKALRLGYTHEGTFYGVPAWFMHVEEGFISVRIKFSPYRLWCAIMEEFIPNFLAIRDYKEIS